MQMQITGETGAFWLCGAYRERELFPAGKEGIRGHEFHYFDSTENGTDCVAKNRPETEGGNVSGKEKTTGGDFLIFIIRPTLLL